MNKRKPIGRRSSTVNLDDVLNNNVDQDYTLHTGKKIRIYSITIAAENVADLTYVNELVNGRTQSLLNQNNIKAISSSFKTHQFFPVIARLDENGKYELYDGSRRRASAVATQRPLDVLYTKDSITVDEAIRLAKDIQTSKEHSLYDLGHKYTLYKEAYGVEQKDIALAYDVSESTVSRAMKAYAVPFAVINLFVDVNALTHSDYDRLSKLSDDVISKLELIENDFDSNDDVFLAISTLLPNQNNKNKIESVTSDMAQFNDKNKYAKKKVTGNKVEFKFNRISQSKMEDIENYIKSVLS